MANEYPLFEEKQYVGYNKHALIRRCVVAIFCLAVYIYSPQYKNADLFLLLGILIVAVSFIMLFVLHLHTIVHADFLILESYWGSRKIKITFNNIVKVEMGHYSKFFFNSPVYNLHLKKTIRFYTYGNNVVKLTDRHGMAYVV